MNPDPSPPPLIAVDIGNSRLKLGRFVRGGCATAEAATKKLLPIAGPELPEPDQTLELPLVDRAGQFDDQQLAQWCDDCVPGDAEWRVGSVHRGAAQRLATIVASGAQANGRRWPLQQLTYQDLPIAIEVNSPERVGIDRLLAALAANQLRNRDRPAIVVDFGTAITVDLVTPAGAFAGGAILPGLAMSARALDEQTDALPRVVVDGWTTPPPGLGRSTVPAIEAGLFWGAVGAVGEVVGQLSIGLAVPPELLVTGGGASLLAAALEATGHDTIRYVPNLVLAGIALAGDERPPG